MPVIELEVISKAITYAIESRMLNKVIHTDSKITLLSMMKLYLKTVSLVYSSH